MAFLLTAVGAALAVGLELAEACAIVLAVGVSRNWSDAMIGAVAGVLACALLAVLLGPVLLENIAIDTLRSVIGALLIVFGLQWLRKGVLRLAGRKSRSSSAEEFEEVEEELGEMPLPPPGKADWTARAVAFKGVLLEGIEVVLIVSVLAARPAGPAPAIVGAAIAVVFSIAVAVVLRRPLARVPETELKFFVGVLLTAFGSFFLAEGLGADWPGGDLALLYLTAAIGTVALMAVRLLPPPRPATDRPA